MELTGTPLRDRLLQGRWHRRVICVALSTAMIGVGPGDSVASAFQTPSHLRIKDVADEAQTNAERLLGGRPYQVVLMQDQKVLMSTSSSGTSLTTDGPLASISKAVTAMVIMRLVEDGLLRLEQTLGAVLPLEMVNSPWKNTTIRQLLTHQSGFDDDRVRWFNSSYASCSDALNRTVSRDTPRNPGSYRYSNTNFCALSLVIAATTGLSYEEASFRYVFSPLGISRQVMNEEYINLLGAGGWQMSALSTARLISALDPQASISPLSVTSRQALIRRTTYNYGLGVWIWDEDSYGHSGSLYRARNIAVRLPSGRVVVILTQATYPESGLDLMPIAQQIDQAYSTACRQVNCEPIGPDPFLGDLYHRLRQTYV